MNTDRLIKLRYLLSTLGCDALLIEHPINLKYLTGLELSKGRLLVTSQTADLIVDGRYTEFCQQQSLYSVHLWEEHTLKELLISSLIHHLGFDSHTTSYQDFLQLKKNSHDIFKQQGIEIELIPLESPIQKLRMIKDPEEIELLRQAARLGYEGYEFVQSQLQEGITEIELALELEFFWKKKGAKGLAFEPIIAFGANSSMPHHRAAKTPLQQGMPVLIDIGVNWHGYHSDMTRVVFFGAPPSPLLEIYAIVEEAKQAALALCRPGTLVGDLDQAARHVINSYGYADAFTHSLGHGIGLDVHEAPIIRTKNLYSQLPLLPGMTLTIEPGIYLPQIGGIRLEDTILITSDSYENFTHL